MSTATAAIQVFRTVDNTTANIGFISNDKVNTAAVDAFCNAAVVGVISRNCFISRVFDQTTNACDIFNTTASGMPDYMVWPSHGGLPIFQKWFQGNMGSLNCAQSLFFAGDNLYGSNIGGQANLQENTPGVVTGSMWGAYIGLTGLTFDHCTNSPPNITTNEAFTHALVTQSRMSWGTTGDHTVNGPALNRTEAFYNLTLTPTQVAALYGNETGFWLRRDVQGHRLCREHHRHRDAQRVL